MVTWIIQGRSWMGWYHRQQSPSLKFINRSFCTFEGIGEVEFDRTMVTLNTWKRLFRVCLCARWLSFQMVPRCWFMSSASVRVKLRLKMRFKGKRCCQIELWLWHEEHWVLPVAAGMTIFDRRTIIALQVALPSMSNYALGNNFVPNGRHCIRCGQNLSSFTDKKYGEVLLATSHRANVQRLMSFDQRSLGQPSLRWNQFRVKKMSHHAA